MFIIGIILILIVALRFVASQYKRCPSNKVIVVYGKTGNEEKTAKCVHGGGVFIIPLIQDYGILSLEPMATDIDLRGALSKGNIFLDWMRENIEKACKIELNQESIKAKTNEKQDSAGEGKSIIAQAVVLVEELS